MQKHPQYGLIILNEQKVSDAVKAACFEHHESSQAMVIHSSSVPRKFTHLGASSQSPTLTTP